MPARHGKGMAVDPRCFLCLKRIGIIPQTGTVGVLNSYYNGSMDKMIWGHDLTPLTHSHLTPADPQPLEGQHNLTPADPSHLKDNMV